jgi:hypothetical protein
MAQVADSYIEAIRGAQCARILDALDGEATSIRLRRRDPSGTVEPSWEAVVTSAATGETQSFGGADVADVLAQAAQWLTLEPSPRTALELVVVKA